VDGEGHVRMGWTMLFFSPPGDQGISHHGHREIREGPDVFLGRRHHFGSSFAAAESPHSGCRL
jgi:hypothetical protein